ncbi:hypothetical protein [Nocardia sp. 348MFTsu5.1]|uniref:hypothetical protein n=1 Tax=Nocardia sp. 348MFTsu5.1 TaxID=1172185 RepID=UPI00037158DA|nr:hypothetical protein [Nocardia sp. 348MFTsu5.1]
MSRLIDIQPGLQELPTELVVGVGDVLRFAATGGHLRSGTAVELIGILAECVLGTDGSVVSPMGAPNTVLFRATAPGNAVIDVVTGDPWRSPVTHRLEIRVEQ